MTPQPNPAPTSAPFRLVPREPCLAVFPHEFPRGIKPGRAGAEGAPAVPFFDAFLRHWPTDAFAVPYLTDFPPDDVPPEGLQPRRCMSDLEDCYSRSLWLDWDTERKTWTDEQRADSAAVFAAIEAERAAIDAAVGAGLPQWHVRYPTRGGWRLAYVSREPIPTAEMRPFIVRLMKRAKKAGLAIDEACKDPVRFMRLPNVVRDGVATWTEPYMADGVDFYGGPLLDVRGELPAGADEPEATAEVAAVSDVEAVAFRDSLNDDERNACDAYAAGAFRNKVAEVTAAKEGSRNQTLFNGACALFEFANSGSLDHDEVSAALTEAGAAAGLSDTEVASSIRSAAGKVSGKGYDFRRFIEQRRYNARVGTSKPAPVPAPAPAIAADPESPAEDEGPIDHAPTVDYPVTDSRGAPFNVKENWGVALQKLGIRVWRDQFTGRDMVDGLPERDLGDELTDDTERHLRFLVEQRLQSGEVPPMKFHELLSHECLVNRQHPVREYLASLEWDGVPRLASLLPRYFGAEDTELHREFGRLHLCAAVVRVLRPGAKYDEVLVLEGPQGVNKSTAIQALCPRAEWFLDDLALGADSKVVIEQTRGKVFIELAELTGMNRKDVEKVKAMVSRQSDRARAAYGRRSEDIPRQSVFWGTTNDGEYLRDQTGNRRFWPVRIGKIDVEAIRRDRGQLWAEAVALVRDGASIRLDPKFYALAADAQAERTIEDPFGDKLAAVLAPFEGVEHVRVRSDDLWAVLDVPLERRGLHSREFGAACQRLGFVLKRAKLKGARDTYRVRGDVNKAQTIRWKGGRFVRDENADASPSAAKVANAKTLGLVQQPR